MKILLFILTFLLFIPSSYAIDDARLAIHLLDYLASDYSGAVQNGQVKSSSEYEEQLEFSAKILSIVSPLNQKEITTKADKLKNLIIDKKSSDEVSGLARSFQRDLISYTKISFSPEVWPSIKRGKLLFNENCINCHGAKGYGDGLDGKNMLPSPSNFHKPERMNKITAFHCYNTIRLGVPGTGMVAFDKLDDKQIWDLSFYIMSLQFTEKNSSKLNNIVSIKLSEFTVLTNDEIKNKYDQETLEALRTDEYKISFEDYLNIAQNGMDKILPTYLQGENEKAKKFAIQAYLQGIEPIEPAVKANRPELITKLEITMSEIRKLVSKKHNEEKLEVELSKIKQYFIEIKATLTDKKLSFSVALLGTFIIVLREGLEAVLLLVTLLSVIGAMKNKKAQRYIHYGWTSALFVGVIMWYLSGELLNVSGIGREMLEAITALLAVIILLYFGFWLHQKTEITKWKNFLQDKINNALINKNLFTLFSISFMAVFREAFETVLFIRSLWFQTSSHDQNAIPYGVLLALLVIILVAYLLLRYSKNVPLRKLFQVSSFMMSTLAIILTGKAIHSFQEVGILPIHSTSENLRFELLGIFPSFEVIIPQVILAAIIYYVLNGINLKKT